MYLAPKSKTSYCKSDWFVHKLWPNHFVIRIPLIWVILIVIYYPYLQLPIIHFNIQKRLYLSSVDADSIKSIISAGMLKSLNPDVVIIPTKVSISSITGHKLSIL